MELFWWFRLAAFHGAFEVLAIFSALASFFLLIPLMVFFHDEKEEKIRKTKEYIRKAMMYFCVCLFCSCAIPGKTEIALMFGWDAIKSESVAEVVELLKDKYLKQPTNAVETSK